MTSDVAPAATDGTLETVRRHVQQQAREPGYLEMLLDLWAWTAAEIARTRAGARQGDGGDEPGGRAE